MINVSVNNSHRLGGSGPGGGCCRLLLLVGVRVYIVGEDMTEEEGHKTRTVLAKENACFYFSILNG